MASTRTASKKVAATPAIKICKRMVWKDYEQVQCNHPYTGEFCKNRDNHIIKYRTGFCGIGLCEGTKPHSASGVPMKTCPAYLTCPCDCHKALFKMFQMSEMPRLLVENPEYHPPHREFWMPSDDPNYGLTPLSSDEDTDTRLAVESPAPDIVPPSVGRSYAPTATGRAARGELESWVKEVCDVWLIEKYQMLCTPAWISEEIADMQAIKPPSVGAISAVFERWVKLGFANIAKKPTRFLNYTEEGKSLGLEALKIRAKRIKKRTQAEQRRGSLR